MNTHTDAKLQKQNDKSEKGLPKIIMEETLGEQCNLTLQHCVTNIFMPRKAMDFSQNAIDSYKNSFVRIFRYLGDLQIMDITAKDISDFLISLQTAETVTHKYCNGKTITTDKPLSYDTIIKHYTVLHSIFADAYREDKLINTNPMKMIDRPQLRKDTKIREMKLFNMQEVSYIIECLSQETLQWQLILWLMLYHGMTRGEVTGLRWKCVNFDSCTVKIENNLQYSPAKGVYDTIAKGKNNRAIKVDPHIINLMRILANTRIEKHPNMYCFTQANGSPMHPQTPTKYLNKFGKKHGIQGLKPSALYYLAIKNELAVAGLIAKLGNAEESLP